MKLNFDVFLYAAIAALNFAQAYSGVHDWRFWTGLIAAGVVAVKAKLSPAPSQTPSAPTA